MYLSRSDSGILRWENRAFTSATPVSAKSTVGCFKGDGMVSGGRQQSQNKFTEQVQCTVHVDTYCITLQDYM